MTPLRRIAIIGNSLPRRCGIATFTTDLQQAISTSRPNLETCIVAMTDHLNAGRFDTVCLQHEFGIFGGEAGAHILLLLSRLTMPVVTTFHTVLAKPTITQREVMECIVAASSKVVVMANKARELLRSVYQVPDEKIEVIAHGIPDVAFVGPDAAKDKLGFGGKPVILTFGLLSPNKGIEVMIDAMPSILRRRADAVYVVLGATHPNLVRDQGEAYRESLISRVRELGVEDHVVFLDPYSFGLGKPVVSTPYWHARELLAHGRGVLVPFGDAAAIGSEIAELLTDDARRHTMCRRAYAVSRTMTWERAAERYVSAFENARQGHWLKVVARSDTASPEPRSPAAPDMQIGHFLSMCDDTGVFQHAVHSVPDRSHGYCVDDNARALLLACALNNPGEQRLPEVLTARFAAFVQHAWNPDTLRFRNFMSFNRTWLEDSGSEDSHGRTLWALGECARRDASPSRRQWAAALFAEALPTVETFRSPRAWAFTLLGLDAYCATNPDDFHAGEIRHRLAESLMTILAWVESPGWVWFEEGLAYDNARTQQTASGGHFRPIGTAGFGEQRQHPRAFDQQPLEATASIAACLTAWRAEGDVEWKTIAMRIFGWFLGSNDLSIALVDPHTGSCRDGLHPDRANENRGGESVLSYLLGLAEIRQLAHVNVGLTHPAPAALRAVGA